MCGICGYASTHAPLPPHVIRDMAGKIYHRGPDSDGFFETDHVALGFRRLSIIDLSTGDQPIGNEDGSVQIVFNGEIYNFQEVRDRLIAAGHRFHTKSDTETIVHAYEEYGVECVKHLRGMFAFAIWDQKTRKLFIGRDRVGKKPLYYYHAPGLLVFGSELKALIEHPAVPRELNLSAVDSYLALKYVPAPLSIFKDVNKLPPGHWLLYDQTADQVTVSPYWSLSYTPKSSLAFEDAAAELRRLLSDAVRLRMISDVPLGALLSGGVDSSLVVGLMASHSSQPIKTYSIGFEEDGFNELPYAREVAQKFATDHHEFVVRAEAVDVFSDLVYYMDEPMADVSAVPSYYVAKLARQHVTVVLNGDGGDETFAGYNSYRAVLQYQRYKALPAWLRRGMVEPALALAPGGETGSSTLARMRRLIQQSQRPLADQFLRWMTMIDSDRLAALRVHDAIAPSLITNREAGIGALDWMLHHDVHNYLPGDLLVKMDRMTMANSLEARSPLLDHEVMEFVAHLPEDYKFKDGVTKRILKHACADLLPESVTTRRKHGFGVPINAWLRQGALRTAAADLIFGASARERGLFNLEAVQRLWDEHQAGSANHGDRLWALAMLERWQQHFLQSAPVVKGA